METATSASSSLAEALFGKTNRTDEVWSEVRFDSPANYLECRRGETVLEMLVSEVLVHVLEAAAPRVAVCTEFQVGTLPASTTVLIVLSSLVLGSNIKPLLCEESCLPHRNCT
jgi:hypothetical protein